MAFCKPCNREVGIEKKGGLFNTDSFSYNWLDYPIVDYYFANLLDSCGDYLFIWPEKSMWDL